MYFIFWLNFNLCAKESVIPVFFPVFLAFLTSIKMILKLIRYDEKSLILGVKMIKTGESGIFSIIHF